MSKSTQTFYLTRKSLDAIRFYATENGYVCNRNGVEVPNLSAALDAILKQLNKPPQRVFRTRGKLFKT